MWAKPGRGQHRRCREGASVPDATVIWGRHASHTGAGVGLPEDDILLSPDDEEEPPLSRRPLTGGPDIPLSLDSEEEDPLLS